MFFTTTNNKQITSLTNTHSLSLSLSRYLVMILNRGLDYNQLSGTIPSSIGSLVNLEYLYVNPTCDIHKCSSSSMFFTTNNKQFTYLTNTHSLTLSLSLSILYDDIDIIEQDPPQKSTEWHHSIFDWLSRENSVLVRQSIKYMLRIVLRSITYSIRSTWVEQISPEQSIEFTTAAILANQTPISST